MRDSKKKGYHSILIVEDDFIFDKEICNEMVVRNVEQFMMQKKRDTFIYSFGLVPYCMMPHVHNSNRVFLKSGTHCSVYSGSCRDAILQTPQEAIQDWDVYTNFNFPNYCHAKPLCYQLFTDTENYKNWGESHPYLFIVLCFIKNYLKYYKLDTSIEGYHQTYVNAFYILYGLFLLLAILFLFFLYLLIRFTKS
jgi:hypothetical protein